MLQYYLPFKRILSTKFTIYKQVRISFFASSVLALQQLDTRDFTYRRTEIVGSIDMVEENIMGLIEQSNIT